MKNTMFSFDEEREIELYLEEKLNPYFIKFLNRVDKSDEIGHTEGPSLQKEVGRVLSEKYQIDYVLDKKGKKKTRAFADNIVDGRYNNVKFTIKNSSTPNIGSMNRMIEHVLEEKNQVYYVTIVHFNLETKTIKVYFVNILQYVDCLGYDSGTGQIMVNQKKFHKEYQKYIQGKKETKTTLEIEKKILELAIKQQERHIQRKTKKLEGLKNKYHSLLI
jgi:hypothetical protein